MKTLICLLLLCSPAFASKKSDPELVYQDAVLTGFHMASDGASCSSTGQVTNSPGSYADATVNTNTSCSDTKRAYYVISVGGQTLTLTTALSGKQTAKVMLTMGYGALFIKDSCLYGQLPGTPIKIRSDSNPGKYFVKVGKRESLYRLAGAE
jgi:hypothetical protein